MKNKRHVLMSPAAMSCSLMVGTSRVAKMVARILMPASAMMIVSAAPASHSIPAPGTRAALTERSPMQSVSRYPSSYVPGHSRTPMQLC